MHAHESCFIAHSWCWRALPPWAFHVALGTREEAVNHRALMSPVVLHSKSGDRHTCCNMDVATCILDV